ncbi:MAG: hypothetical protein Q9181_006616 [Wetmoreana brouardii]
MADSELLTGGSLSTSSVDALKVSAAKVVEDNSKDLIHGSAQYRHGFIDLTGSDMDEEAPGLDNASNLDDASDIDDTAAHATARPGLARLGVVAITTSGSKKVDDYLKDTTRESAQHPHSVFDLSDSDLDKASNIDEGEREPRAGSYKTCRLQLGEDESNRRKVKATKLRFKASQNSRDKERAFKHRSTTCLLAYHQERVPLGQTDNGEAVYFLWWDQTHKIERNSRKNIVKGAANSVIGLLPYFAVIEVEAIVIL